MRRNTVGVIVMLAFGILWVPLAAHAQPPAKMPRVGYLTLRAGPTERLPALAAELVRLQVDCIAAQATPVVQAAKDATQSLPIVMTAVADPVGTGFVASLARPGGNITGMAGMGPELAGKRLERLRDLLPTLSRVAFLAYGGDPAHRLWIQETQDAAARLGMQVQPLVIGSVEEIERAFAAMRSERAEALIVQPLFTADLGQGQRIADLAVQHRLPTVSTRGFAEAGGLMSYGADVPAMIRRSAVFVDKILKGTKPGDLPVEQPMTFKLIINLKTARVLGLPIPPTLLFQADEVIPIGRRRGTERGRGTGIREHNHGVSDEVLECPSRTWACRDELNSSLLGCEDGFLDAIG